MSNDKGVLKPRAYARLLTMIGDQLIKNEKIALIELIKNAYDADASWVQIRFNNFTLDEDENTFIKGVKSSIEIEDDGIGMQFETIESVWLNPATPNKYLQKQGGENKTKIKKRIIQGEKGIGRFAVYKLGATIELTTRFIEKERQEIYIINDLSSFDGEVIGNTKKVGPPKFLDQIEFIYDKRPKPIEIIKKQLLIRNERVERKPHGTIIKITNLRGEWSQEKINDILSDVSKLSTPIANKTNDSFICDIQINGDSQHNADKDSRTELKILEVKAPIKITNGSFDNKKLSYHLNGNKVEISLNALLGVKEFRRRFASSDNKALKRLPECGPFTFQFFIYDFSSKAPEKYKLLRDEKEIIRDNRIYLYRDNMRVAPYGDKSDDWLEVDILRGTGRAGDYLSNDQTVGFIGITTKDNPDLKDKTNREGLLEIGNSFDDFKILIQSILGLLHDEFKRYKLALEAKNKITLLKESQTQNQFENFKKYLEEKKDSKGGKVFDVIYKNYVNEKKYLKDRAEITEDLAAVGLTVEAASHDLMLMMHKANSTLGLILGMTENKSYDHKKLNEGLKKLKGHLEFIESQIEGIQPIFRSTKRQSKDIKVIDMFNDVRKYYESIIEDNEIEVITQEIGKNLTIHCTEGILLQTFINLIDNSTYWLKTLEVTKKQITVIFDKDKKEVIFADNGPGIKPDDQQFIFEPFFSTKGLQGRGLGLYIAKQLLDRYDFEISYISDSKKKILPGANFLIRFHI